MVVEAIWDDFSVAEEQSVTVLHSCAGPDKGFSTPVCVSVWPECKHILPSCSMPVLQGLGVTDAPFLRLFEGRSVFAKSLSLDMIK